MHPLLDVRPWPRVLLQYPLLMLTAVLLGAGAGFAYSYAPLHRAKDWQIDYLEERLAARTDQVEGLERELVAARSSLDDQPSSEEVEGLRARLDEATSVQGSLEKQVNELERKLAQATRSRDSWRKKHAALSAELDAAQAREAAPPQVAPPEAVADATPSAPGADATEEAAAPAAPASTTPSNLP